MINQQICKLNTFVFIEITPSFFTYIKFSRNSSQSKPSDLKLNTNSYNLAREKFKHKFRKSNIWGKDIPEDVRKLLFFGNFFKSNKPLILCSLSFSSG